MWHIFILNQKLVYNFIYSFYIFFYIVLLYKMSLYSNGSIKSIILDPTHYRANSRASFKLDGDRIYKSDLKLANVGLTVAADTQNPVPNKLAGVGSLIKRIALLDGKTELDSCNEVHRYYGFQQLLDENKGNESMNRYLVHNSQGLRTSEQVKKAVNLKPVAKLATTAAATPQGLIDIRDMLPLLRSMDMLDASKTFPNLRLEVEFETDAALLSSDVTSPVTTLEPVLLCDVIEDPNIMSGIQKQMPSMVQWNKIEHDVVNVKEAKADGTAVTAGVQTTSKKVRGFDNKRVGRLLAVKAFANSAKTKDTNAVLDVGNLGSIAGYDEIFNVRINGKNVLARKGNDKAPNQRMAMVVDAYGDMASYFGSNLISINSNDALVTDGVNKTGRLDYFGIVVNDDIQDLQLNYDRTHLATANNSAAKQQVKTNAAVDIHLYAEVAKTLSMSPNGYNVAYV